MKTLEYIYITLFLFACFGCLYGLTLLQGGW